MVLLAVVHFEFPQSACLLDFYRWEKKGQWEGHGLSVTADRGSEAGYSALLGELVRALVSVMGPALILCSGRLDFGHRSPLSQLLTLVLLSGDLDVFRQSLDSELLVLEVLMKSH